MKKSFSFMMATVMACSAVPVSSAFATETAAVSTIATSATTEELAQILAEKEAELENAKADLEDAKEIEATLRAELANAQEVEAILAALNEAASNTTAEDEDAVELTEDEIAAAAEAVAAAQAEVDSLDKTSAILAIKVIAAADEVATATTAVTVAQAEVATAQANYDDSVAVITATEKDVTLNTKGSKVEIETDFEVNQADAIAAFLSGKNYYTVSDGFSTSAPEEDTTGTYYKITWQWDTGISISVPDNATTYMGHVDNIVSYASNLNKTYSTSNIIAATDYLSGLSTAAEFFDEISYTVAENESATTTLAETKAKSILSDANGLDTDVLQYNHTQAKSAQTSLNSFKTAGSYLNWNGDLKDLAGAYESAKNLTTSEGYITNYDDFKSAKNDLQAASDKYFGLDDAGGTPASSTIDIGSASASIAFADSVAKGGDNTISDAEFRLTFGNVTTSGDFDGYNQLQFDIDLSGAKFNKTGAPKANTQYTLKGDAAIKLLTTSATEWADKDINDSYYTVSYSSNLTSMTVTLYIHQDPTEDAHNDFGTDFFKNNSGVAVKLENFITMNSNSTGATSYISASTDDSQLSISNASSSLLFATVVDAGMVASIKTLDYVAEEEVIVLANSLNITETVSGSFSSGTVLELKINSGFNLDISNAKVTLKDSLGESQSADVLVNRVTNSWYDAAEEDNLANGYAMNYITDDDDEDPCFYVNEGIIYIDFNGFGFKNWSPSDSTRYRIEIEGLELEAKTAKSGDEAIVTINSNDMNRITCQIAEVTAYAVDLTVDEDLSVPVMYNTVDAANTGLTTGRDQNWSKVITLEETFPGAWAGRNAFSFVLPDGVYVTNVDILESEYFYYSAGLEMAKDGVDDEYSWEYKFKKAYDDGEQEVFEFSRRTFDDVTTDNRQSNEKAKLSFKLELIAQPGFEGEVVFTTEGIDIGLGDDGVVIAEFISPYTAQAFQNNVIIDYRYTPLDTDITIRETEPGLWDTNTVFWLSIDRATDIIFEDTAIISVASSDMELRSSGTGVNDTPADDNDWHAKFTVKSESTDDAAEIVVSNMELYMKRDIPAGAYSLSIDSTMEENFRSAALYGHWKEDSDGDDYKETVDRLDYEKKYDDTVPGGESFVNVVTAGSDVGDATFLTSIVVPIGGTVMIVGGVVQPLSTSTTAPSTSYINADGYTMLPVRAIADAVGSAGIEVLWNGDNSTVTILYPGTVVNMRVGEKIMTINGNEVPSSAALEIFEDRAYLPLRDLARAIGVDTSRIAYDSYQHAAIINGTESDIYTILKTAGLDKDTVGSTATTIPSGDDEEPVADED